MVSFAMNGQEQLGNPRVRINSDWSRGMRKDFRQVRPSPGGGLLKLRRAANTDTVAGKHQGRDM